MASGYRRYRRGRGRGEFQNNPTSEFVPGSDVRPEEVYTFPFLVDEQTVEYITANKKVMFIVRGPPGSGKSTLSGMLREKYFSSVVCSADNYFSEAFVDKLRNPETLRESHNYCQRRVKQECERGTHPIIVQNTHMRRWEFSPYLELAEQYGYNVIMAITLRKFIVSAEVLEKTNKKGLTKMYFENRLKQWQEFIPLYTGWFLGHDDSLFVLNEAKKCLELLLGDSKFCSVMNAFSEDDIWNGFQLESPLFCIATYCGYGKKRTQWDYYLSKAIQDVYGKYFGLTIQGILVTKSEVLAVVALTSEMASYMITFEDGNSADESSLCDALSSMSAKSGKECRSVETFTKDLSNEGSTAAVHGWEDGELIDVNQVSVIVLAEKSNTDALIIKNPSEFAVKMFSTVTNAKGYIEDRQYLEFSDDTRYFRLAGGMWFVKLPMKITVGSVFTGRYC